MCLHIDSNHHIGIKKVKARVAGYDMLVYKVLRRRSGKLLAPYRRTRWFIGKPMVADMLVSVKNDEPYATDREDFETDPIHVGVHAMLTPDGAARLARQIAFNQNGVYPAVIPAGARFWIGRRGDIVATEMTVYKTVKDALQGRTLGEANFKKHKTVR